MEIAVIGGGITGLTAAFDLTKTGHSVTLYEQAPFLGGLAHGFRQPEWDWPIESAYHHLFTNDRDILHLVDELGITDRLITTRPVTATLWKNKPHQLDSPMSLLRFPGMPFTDRVRTGMMIAALKINPLWQPLEQMTAERLIRGLGGDAAWQTVWEPLMVGKFDAFAPKVSAAWFWARIKKRTADLVYFRGGFDTFITSLSAAAKKQGAHIRTSTSVSEIRPGKRDVILKINGRARRFRRVIVTTPSPVFVKLAPTLPQPYRNRLLSVPHLTAHILILETAQPVLKNIYWLNITDRSFPFLAVVAHTNFMDPARYGGHHLTYIGNYLPDGHPFLSKSSDELLKLYTPYLRKLNPSFRNPQSVIRHHLFIGPYAQPVHTLRYSRKAPPMDTPLPDVCLANMDSIYPWDRGTNYAVKLGRDVSRSIIK